MVIKPSERTRRHAAPRATAQGAGLPDGVFNVVHGAHDTVDYIIDEPAIRAISFVGSNPAGEYIHELLQARARQANLGAQNHGRPCQMPTKAMMNGLTGSAFGAAGQRCMALSRAIFVGESKNWIPELAQRSAALQVGAIDRT